MKQRIASSIWFYVVLFLLTRIVTLIFLHPFYYTLGGGEEPFVAAIGREFLLGSHFSLSDFLFDTSQGGGKWGHMIVAVLMVPFYSLLGFTTFASKIPSLLFFCGTLIFWWHILTRWLEPKAAPFFALLFIFSPPSFTQFSHTTLGHNFESLFFTAATIFLAFRILYDQKQNSFFLLLFGVFMGISTLFCYVFAITLITLLLFTTYILKPKPPAKCFTLPVVGFFVGISPWILYSLATQFSGIYIYDQPIWDHFSLRNLLTLITNPKHSILIAAPHSLAPPFWGLSKWLRWGTVLPYLMLGSVILLSFLKYRDATKPSKPQTSSVISILCLFVACNLALCQIGSFLAPRYFIMSAPFLFALLAFLLTRIRKGNWVRLFTVGIISLHFLTFLPMLSFSDIGRIFRTKSYSYQWLDGGICKDWQRCVKNYADIATDFEPEDRSLFTISLAQWVATAIIASQTPDPSISKASLPREIWRYIPYFIGRSLVEDTSILETQNRVTQIANDYKIKREALLFGILDASGENFIPFETLPKTVRDNPKLMSAYWRAMGFYVASLNHSLFPYPDSHRMSLKEQAAQAPENHREAFLQGWGKQLYDYWASKPVKPSWDPFFLTSLKEPYQTPILHGIGQAMTEREFDWQIADHAWYFEAFTRSSSLDQKNTIMRGKHYLEALL